MERVPNLLSVLEDVGETIKKALINLKKCPKQRLTKGYIETRLKLVEDYWDTYRDSHKELVKCVPRERRSTLPYFSNDEYYEVEDTYQTLHSDLKDMLIQIDGCTPKNTDTSSAQVKLPRIELPMFSGVYDEWPTFQDLFLSLVHNNALLSKVQKLHYLKSSLKGEAETLLKHVQVTEANYEQAWDVLKNRYGNKRLIINSLLKKLFTQKKIPTQSAVHLKSLLDTPSECLKSLENLDINIDSWDPLIIFLLVQKLDPESHREWEEFAYKEDSEELPKWDDFVKFLQTKFRTLELVTPPIREKPSRSKEYTVHVATSATPKERSCSICKDNHTLSHCQDFTKMEMPNRIEYVKTNNLCFNCLAPGHSARKCRLNMSCRLCHKRHHTLVHLPQAMTSPNQPGNIQVHHNNLSQENVQNQDTEQVHMTSYFTSDSTTALLATALVPVRDESGRTTLLRALIDHGSQATFISERAAQALKLKREPVNGTITGLGTSTTTVKHAANLELLSRYDEQFNMKVKAYIVSARLTAQLPSQSISVNTWSHIKGLVLADPGFYQPGRIDMLLGVEVCAQIMKAEIIKGPPGTPCAQNTSLGWILFGQVNEDKPHRDHFMVMHMNLDLNLDNMLKMMWELEKREKGSLTAEERKCEEIYQATHTRTDEGRYIVKLPTKTDKLLSKEGRTRDIAIKNLYQNETRFEKNAKLKKEYVEVMQEYLTMNHMEEIPKEEIDIPSVYLPHHAIIKEEKETTKVRCVFNASQKGKNNVSLNEELMIGPQLQDDMRSLIMRWRMKRICFVADIQKMYRQILVTKEDSDLQRIVWRKDKNEPIKDYRLLRVTFGTASAPYLAVKTLHQVAVDEGKDYPEAAKMIKEDFFMDDLMSGKDNLPQAIKTAKEVEMILQRGGFVLQKWCSNDADFLKHFEPSQRSTHVNLDIKIDGIIRALGVQWNMGKDVFQYDLNLPSSTVETTKRTILATMQRLFDPLGWITPSILPGKLLIQRLWLLRLTWDEDVEESVKEEWLEIKNSFQDLKGIEVDRWLQTANDDLDVSIHGFCDASTKAYAAVAYLRVQRSNGEVVTGIIAAKSRVAPVKPVSLPRLELCGAVLLARLLKQIKEATRMHENQIFAWTDSTIVLSWLFGDPNRWNIFVRNRVVEILDITGKNWYHVQTHENPADIASRGKCPAELIKDELWWKGPEWLRNEEINYTIPENVTTNLERKILQSNLLTNETISEETNLANRIKDFETLTELMKTITYCKRFLKGRNMENKEKAFTTEELNESLKTCIKIIQKENFKEDIEALQKNKNVKKDSKIKLLHPYLDEENVLRVGGRLRHADLNEDHKHPIILDGKNNLAALIVADAHLKTLHGGVQLMLGYINTKYWILKAKRLVKRKIHKCLICARQNAAAKNQLMGDLPKVRVTPARPFINSGVDFAGPYQILASKGRGIKINKAYICIFVCMATKAVHLELVGDMTSEAFIGAFRRFVARRGKCAHLWSDQGRKESGQKCMGLGPRKKTCGHFWKYPVFNDSDMYLRFLKTLRRCHGLFQSYDYFNILRFTKEKQCFN